MRANSEIDPDATRTGPLEQVIDMLIRAIRDRQIGKLSRAKPTIEMGFFVISEVLTNRERVSDHCSNLAAALIETTYDSFDTHECISAVVAGDDDRGQLNVYMNAMHWRIRRPD